MYTFPFIKLADLRLSNNEWEMVCHAGQRDHGAGRLDADRSLKLRGRAGTDGGRRGRGVCVVRGPARLVDLRRRQPHQALAGDSEPVGYPGFLAGQRVLAEERPAPAAGAVWLRAAHAGAVDSAAGGEPGGEQCGAAVQLPDAGAGLDDRHGPRRDGEQVYRAGDFSRGRPEVGRMVDSGLVRGGCRAARPTGRW